MRALFKITDAHADEAGIFDDAAVDGGIVADRDPVTNDDGIAIAHAMQHGAVLHIGVGADADGMHIAADDGVHPDAGVLAEGDVADDLGGNIHIAGRRNDGRFALIGTNHGLVRKPPFGGLNSSRFSGAPASFYGDGRRDFRREREKKRGLLGREGRFWEASTGK